MAYYTYWASALTGGGTGAVDKIPTADLSDKCGVIAILLTGTYVYHVDDDSGAAESSPWVIAPDDVGAGNLRLILVDVVAPNLTGKLLKLYDTDFSHSLTVKWNEDDDTNRILNLLMAGGNRSFTLNENLTVGDGTDITLTGVTQANTLTLNESFTIGDGFDGTLTFKNASKALNVEDTNLTPRTGWPTAPGVTLSFSDGDRTFTVTDGGSAFYYILGVKYTLGGNKTVVIDNTEGLWYIYFDGATLTASQTIWSFTAEDKALVAYLNWDATADNEKSIFLGYELHTFHMDGSTHARLHYAGGARWETGLLVTDAGSEIVNVAAGDIWDEDLNLPITDGAGDALFEQVLSPAELPIYYLDGASNWRIYETTAGEKANATDVGYVSAANDLKYNKLNGTWANADVGLNNYVAYYVVATNEQTEPVALIMGQRVDNKLSDAKENNTFSGLTLTDLPFEEMVVLARLILKGTGSGVYYTLEEVLDLRVYNIKGNITSPLIPDHGGLAGLGDDDHVQYVLKSTWGAYSILAADTNDTPAAVTLAVSEMIGRKATGGIVALAKVDILTILNVADGADVTGSNAPQAHTHDDRYYTETESNTWRSNVIQQEMDYLDGVTSDIQGQLNVRCLESVFGTSISTGLSLDGTALKASTILQKYHGVDPSADVLSVLGCATEAAIRSFLDLEAGTDFYSVSAVDTLLTAKAPLASPTFTTAVTIPETAGDADYDKFLVVDTGVIKYRTGAEVLSDIGAGSGVLSHKVINIGDWNMDSTAGVAVAHGLTFANIRYAQAFIRNDNDDNYHPIDYGSPDGYVTLNATNVVLGRNENKGFDNANYDATSFNRGWAIVWYV